MAEKMTCPGCDSHTSAILAAVAQNEPCPYCGLSAAAINEVLSIQTRRADAELTAKYGALVIRTDKAEAEATNLRRQLEQIRNLVNTETGEFRSDFDHREF